jgi:hypothetical protein
MTERIIILRPEFQNVTHFVLGDFCSASTTSNNGDLGFQLGLINIDTIPNTPKYKIK